MDVHWITISGVKTNGQIDVIRLFNVKKPGVTQANTAGEDVKSIIANLLPYSPDLIVADIGDSGDKINQLIDYFGPEVVYGCKYPTTPRSNGQLRASWNGSNNIVSADKLTYNKRYIAKLKQGLVGIYAREDQDFQYYVKHWKNVVIKDVEDERNPGMFYQTITRKGDDHYAQSSVYAMLGCERLMELHYSGDNYQFESSWLQNDLTPTKSDIFSQYGNR